VKPYDWVNGLQVALQLDEKHRRSLPRGDLLFFVERLFFHIRYIPPVSSYMPDKYLNERILAIDEVGKLCCDIQKVITSAVPTNDSASIIWFEIKLLILGELVPNPTIDTLRRFDSKIESAIESVNPPLVSKLIKRMSGMRSKTKWYWPFS